MAYGLIDYNTLNDIANSLREKANTNVRYYPRDMARAIDAIVTGGGIDEPCMFSTGQYYTSYYDNSIINRYMAVGIEVTNTNPLEWQNPPNYYKVIDDSAEWAGFSPDGVIFYERDGVINNQTGNIYGLLLNNKWFNGGASIIDISDLFPYSSNITEPYCGKFTSKMVNSYYGCYKITNAVCGEYVSDMSNAYTYCSNMRTPACGNNVKYMKNTYASCYNVESIAMGPKVVNAYNAYSGCSNATGNVNLGDYLIDISYAFNNCCNVEAFHGTLSTVVYGDNAFTNCVNATFDKFELTNLENAYCMFENCGKLTDIGNFTKLVSADYMFNNCTNLHNIGRIDFNNVTSAVAMFSDVPGVTQETHDRLINTINTSANIKWVFRNCTGFEMAKISNRWQSTYDLNGMYYGCVVNDVDIDYDVNNISYVMYGSGLRSANCTENVTNMQYAFAYCYRLTDAIIGNNVTNAYSAYYHCSNLINAACGTKITELVETYRDCENLVHHAIGPNVTNLYYAYHGCINLQGDLDMLQVNRMFSAFYGANYIQNIVIRSDEIKFNRYHLENAFYRTNYDLRRNIVLTNYDSYVNFIDSSMNSIGQAEKIEENYIDPLAVNVNGVEYPAIRCAYNEAYNVYIYCTE